MSTAKGVAGHRVRVQDIVIWHEHLTFADVHSALAYYFDHVQEIQEDMQADRACVEEFRDNHPSLLDEKLGKEPIKEASGPGCPPPSRH